MPEIAASPESMRAAADAWSRARLFDDKLGDPDAARLAAWAESIEKWKLSSPDCLNGVVEFYEGEKTGRTIGIGDLLHHGREARRQRAEREKAREVHLEVEAAAPPAGYEGLPINAAGRIVWAAYDINGAIDRQCPTCHAQPNDACVVANGMPQKIPCVARINGRRGQLGGAA